jgi:glycerophosphoryl diester phosphodiesterase
MWLAHTRLEAKSASNSPNPNAAQIYQRHSGNMPYYAHMPSFLCIGHRGAAGHEPENTLRSIQHAMQLGVDAVEIDVQLSQDGKLVVIHDSSLRRTTGTAGYVARKTVEQLKLLNAGLGEQIPTLEEVLNLIEGKVLLNIELKSAHTALLVEQKIIEAVYQKRGWTFENIIVSSFKHRELKLVTDPRIWIGALINRPPVNLASLVKPLRAKSIHLPLRLATPAMIKRIHQEELLAFVFTVNEPADIKRMRTLGVDGIFTDFPDRVRGADCEP